MRLRRHIQSKPTALPALVYHAPRTAIGCRFCNALRELLGLAPDDRDGYDRLWTEGECVPTLPDVRWVKTLAGNDGFSQYDFAVRPDPLAADYSTALWFRDADMERPSE